jgi:FAD/FMN-containing dehydrogenase
MAIDIITTDVTALRERTAGAVVAPGDAGFEAARHGWALAADMRPAAVVLAETAQDVVETVRFARENGLRVNVQGTGHNAYPLGDIGDTIVVRTDAMRGVELDVENKRVRVEAGALWLDVTSKTSEHALAPLSGSSPNVGVVGYSLGGGLSWLGRKHGLAANHVLALDVVTADGELKRVDADHEPELFWALRGGGGSFGVVTAMEFRVFDAPEVFAGAMFWPSERAAEVLKVWRDWTETAPDEVTTSARIMNLPPIEDIPEMLRGRSLVVIDGAFLGSEADADALLKPLRDLEPEIDGFGVVPPVALSYIHMDPEDPMPGASATRMLGRLDDAAIDALVAAVGPDSPLLMGELRQLGGALRRRTETAGALATFEGDYILFGAGLAVDPEMGAAVKAAAKALVEALKPYDAGRDYLNFVEEEADVSEMFDADAYARLRRVKGEVDPANLFRANHEIEA